MIVENFAVLILLIYFLYYFKREFESLHEKSISSFEVENIPSR